MNADLEDMLQTLGMMSDAERDGSLCQFAVALDGSHLASDVRLPDLVRPSDSERVA